MLLTKRESQVVETLAETLASNQGIGLILGIGKQTVKNHLLSICNKVGVSNRYQLVQWYYKNKMKERT